MTFGMDTASSDADDRAVLIVYRGMQLCASYTKALIGELKASSEPTKYPTLHLDDAIVYRPTQHKRRYNRNRNNQFFNPK